MHEILLHQWNHVYLQDNFDPLSKKEKVEAGKKIHPNKENRHIQRTDCKLPISIKRMFFSYNCKAIFTSK